MSNLKNNKKEFFLELLKKLLTPAYGCTEIGAVALACSVASEHLKADIKHAKLWISSYIYRNDANVGVPGMGKVGIKAIAGAGFAAKQSKKKLNVLSDITKSQCIKAKKIAKLIDVEIAKNCNPVYVKVIATDKLDNICDVLIEEEHDFIKQIKFNNKLLHLDDKINIDEKNNIQYNFNDISLKDIYTNVQEMKEEELLFLSEGLKMNEEVVKYGENSKEFKLVSIFDNEHTHQSILTGVTLAISARMSGCPLPVMATCDSGDHGLTVALPQVIYHNERKTPILLMLQAVALANLITWKIKKSIGSLSAYCGSVVAAVTGTIAGLGFQRNHTIKQINDLINLCICSFAGSLCDGAKLSCSWKIEAALLTGFKAMDIVEHNISLPDNEGLINKDAFDTITHLGNLSKSIMEQTNNQIIDIIHHNIVHKK